MWSWMALNEVVSLKVTMYLFDDTLSDSVSDTDARADESVVASRTMVDRIEMRTMASTWMTCCHVLFSHSQDAVYIHVTIDH